MESSAFNKVFTDGVLVSVHVGAWTGERELIPSDLGLKIDDVVDAFDLGKKNLFPEAISAAFRKLENKGRNIVKRNAFAFPIGSCDFVPKAKFEEIVKTLESLQTEYYRLADEVCEPTRYEELKAQMTPVYIQAADKAFEKINPVVAEFGATDDPEALRLRREEEKAEFIGKFIDSHLAQYPAASTLRSKFYYFWDIYQIAVPDMDLSSMDDVLTREAATAAIRDQMNQKISGFVEDVVKTLRKETVDVCGRIAKSIKEGKVIRSTTIESLKSFVDRFKTMNFVGDQTIEAQLNALSSEYLDIDSKSLAADIDLQQELGKKLEGIAEAAGKIAGQDIDGVTSQYVRVVNWHD